MSEHVAHTETDEATGVRLQIIQDGDSQHMDPSENDEAIIFAMLHRDYHNPAKGAESRSNVPSIPTEDGEGETFPDFESSEGLRAFVKHACGEGKDWEAFPLFMYEHSGVAYRVSRGGNPFSCPWDSGQVGFVFVHKPDIGAAEGEAPDYFESAKVFTQVYEDWASGNVWGYVVEDGDGEHVDSCWGFIGDSDDKYLMGEARGAFHHAIGNAQAKLDAEARAEERAANDVDTVRAYLAKPSNNIGQEVLDAFNRLHPEVTGYLDVMGVVDGDSDEDDSDED